TMTFTMSALPGTPALQNAIPMPFFGTTPFAAPGIGILAGVIVITFGLWWLGYSEKGARQKGERFSVATAAPKLLDDPKFREQATLASEFDPAEIPHGYHAGSQPSVVTAILPLVVVIIVNLTTSAFVLPRLDTSFLAEEKWGGTSLAAVGGVWAVVIALF